MRERVETLRRERPDQVPVPGTSRWIANVVDPLLEYGDRKNHSYPSVVEPLPAFTLVSHLESFAYFRGQGMIPVKTIASMLAGGSRSKGVVSSVGLVRILVRRKHGGS